MDRPPAAGSQPGPTAAQRLSGERRGRPTTVVGHRRCARLLRLAFRAVRDRSTRETSRTQVGALSRSVGVGGECSVAVLVRAPAQEAAKTRFCSAVAAGGPAVPWPASHAGWTRLKTVQRTPRGRALRGRTPERPRIRPWVRSGRGGSRYVQWQRAGICAVKRVRPMTSTTPGVQCASARPSRVPIAGFVELGTHVRPPCLLRRVRFGCCNRSRAAASLPTHERPRPSACHAGPGHVRPLAALIVGGAGQAGAVSLVALDRACRG